MLTNMIYDDHIFGQGMGILLKLVIQELHAYMNHIKVTGYHRSDVIPESAKMVACHMVLLRKLSLSVKFH